MILTPDQIKDCITNPKRADDIKTGIDIQNQHKVHITGEGYKDSLKDIIGERRALDYGDRELKEPITKFLTKKIKDELSRWKNTQGTRKWYDFGSNEELAIEFRKEVMSQVWKGGSIDKFAGFLNDALYTDFGGFVIIEKGVKIDEGMELRDGIPTRYKGKQKPYVIFKSLSDVHDFRLTGEKVEYLILKYGERDGVKLYRVLDDSGDYIYCVRGDVMKASEQWPEDKEYNDIPNSLGYVAAMQISDVVVTPLNDHVKTSHIFQTLPLLQDYMTRHAEHTISELLHASPLLALKGTKCTYVSPDGNKCSNGKIFDGENMVNCPACNGVGATVPKNSSEVIIVPELDKQGNTYDPSLIGQYIVPPTEILEHQAKELDQLEQRVIYSGTGIKSLVKAQIQTATEIVLNLKPLEDKISSILDNIESVETFVTDTIGKMLYDNKFEGSQIHYGRKLNIRDENLILNEIEQSKRAGLPVSQIRMLLEELIMTRYRNSKNEMTRALMMLDLEPLSTESVEFVLEALYATDKDKWMKMNFDDYIDQFENEFGPINLYKAGEPMNKRIKQIKKILTKYNDGKSNQGGERSGTGDVV